MLGSSGQLPGLLTSPQEHKSAPTQVRLGQTAALPVQELAALGAHQLLRVGALPSNGPILLLPKALSPSSLKTVALLQLPLRLPGLFSCPSSHFPLVPPTAPYGSFPSPIRERPKAPCPGASPSPHEVIAGLIASRRSSTAASWPTAPERAPAPFRLALYIVQGPISCPANQVEVAPPPDPTSVSHFSISSYARVIMMDSFLSSISSLVDL